MKIHMEFIFTIITLLITISEATVRAKRMYALCPPKFIHIGKECYYISQTSANWLDAHFECKDRNSRLAEPIKTSDRQLRKYLLHTDMLRSEKWIGGLYNWEKSKWQWGYNGRDMGYQSFSQMIPGSRQDLKFHCAVLNPELKYRWSARSCVDKHQFICQHRMPYVTEKNRERVYSKWNVTYPNEMANEVETVINQDYRRRNDQQNNRTGRIQFSNDHRIYRGGIRNPNRRIDNRHIYKNPIRTTEMPTNGPRVHRQRITSNNVIQTNDVPMPNDSPYRNPIVQHAPDPRNELQLASNMDTVTVAEPADHKRRRMENQTRKNPMRQRRRKVTTTTESPTTQISPEEQARLDLEAKRLAETKQQLENQRIYEENIRKEEQNRKEELKRREEEEQRRADELKARDEEEERRQQELINRDKELKRREDEEKAREKELINREEELKRRKDDELARSKELENREAEEKRRIAEQKNRDNESKLRAEQENVRQQELNNRQIEERIRQDEERKRQEELRVREVARKKIAELDPHMSMNHSPGHDSRIVKVTSPGAEHQRKREERIRLDDARIEERRTDEEEKKRRRSNLRARLAKLSPEAQEKFIAMRLERYRKRGIEQPSDNDTVIPNK